MAEHTTQRLTIRATPAQCFQVVTDFDNYPQWAADIKQVTIEERDDQGRAARVTFRAAAFGRSTTLTLDYDYSRAPGRLEWTQARGDLTNRYDGAYSFEAVGDGDTEVTYDLDVELRVPLPGFIKRRTESRIISTALRELQARVEGARPTPAP
ncbi:MAG TPA: SRPBCC family protein [Acidimicrobiales bacterium]|nr:SRPBCC family protein [Acidimicrobiales bacterium]